MGGGQPDPPKPPDYAAANREGIYADIETLPDRLKIESAAKLGKIAQVGGKTVDFTGLGDAANIQQQLDLLSKSAPALAQTEYDVRKQYDPLFIELSRQGLQQSDPYAFALDEALKKQTAEDLALGSTLSDKQRRDIEQATRAGQVARGNFLGPTQSAEEAFNIFSSGETLKGQRQAAALAALGRGGQNNQFASLAGAQEGATPFAGINPQQTFRYINPNASALGTGFAQQSYGGQASTYSPGPDRQGQYIGAGVGLAAAAGVAAVAL